MAYKKTYVEVVASFREDGLLLPREIVWEDGRRYEIDRVSDIRSGASMKVGGQGDRYTIWQWSTEIPVLRAKRLSAGESYRAMVC